MLLLDFSHPSPEENLAADESLLDAAEDGRGQETLRFWEPSKPFVVLGYSGRLEDDVHRDACRKKDIPILRRCSGGGTVLQGPGCLNYALILRIDQHPQLKTIVSTNRYVMERQRSAFEKLLGGSVEVQGHTDLALNGRKFSGNAQRRKRNFVLFHGTVLLAMDIGLISEALTLPPRRPAYRADRSHRDFLTNLSVAPKAVKEAIRTEWGAAPMDGAGFEPATLRV